MNLKKTLVMLVAVNLAFSVYWPLRDTQAQQSEPQAMFKKTEISGITTIAKGTNGVAIADFNRDGLMDFLDTNQPPRGTKNAVNTMRMLIGKGSLTYKEQPVTLEGTTLKFENMGLSAPQVPVVADFNRDGFLDIFVTRNRGRESKTDKTGNQLLISSGAFDRFTDMSEKMGVRNIEAYNRQPSPGDINGDGWLDIAVGADNISKASYAGNPESRVYIFQPKGEKFEDGTFRDISDDKSLLPDFSGTYDGNPENYRGGPDIDLCDLDNDGDLDLIQAYHNDMNTMGWETHDDPGIAGKQHFGVFCWRNMLKEEGKFRFVRVKDNGLATEGWCRYNKEKQVYEPVQHSIGVPYLSFGDADNDGLDDAINVGPTASSWHVNSDFISGQYWKNLGNFKFRESTSQAGLEALNWTYGDWHKFWKLDAPEIMTTVKEGTKYKLQPGLTPTPAILHQPYFADAAFGDFDNDGWQDFALCDRSQRRSDNFRNIIFRNDGKGKFAPVEWQASGIVDNSICTEVADLNNDGLLDLYFMADPDNSGIATSKEDYKSSVYINTGANGAKDNHWIRLRFSGLPDSEIIGGKATAHDPASSEKILGFRQISANQSYKSGSALEAHFGLGKHESIDLTFTTPSGKKLYFRNLKANNYYDLNLATYEVKPAGPVSKDSGQAASAKGKPNIIFFLTDDLDIKLGTMNYTPKIKKHMADAGATFTQFFISNTLCCPSRTTILRGQFSHNNKVLTNGGPDGGFERFLNVGNEDSTIATWLEASGYKTVLMGKFLNGYPLPKDPTHVPKGWTEWYSPAKGNAYGCYNYTMNENGKLVAYGSEPDDYMNDVLSAKATDFIGRMTKDGSPFFAYIAPYSPHSPATPAKRHENLFPNIKAPRTPNFDEADISDKPPRFRTKKKLTDKEIAGLDKEYGLRVRSMQSVDDMVENVVKALEKAGQLDNTYLAFIGDNGFHLGQHRLPGGKGFAYEEDILVPCYIRGPGIKAGSTVSEYLTGNVDLASTFADMAGVTSPDFVDGRSLLPLARGEKPKTWRNAYFIEFYPYERPKAAIALMKEGIYEDYDADEAKGENVSKATYIALRTKTHTYIEHQVGVKEFYDIIKDPWQLENQAEKADKSLLAKYSAWANQLLEAGGAKLREIEEKTIENVGSEIEKKAYETFADIVYKTTDADKNLTSLDVYTPHKSGNNPVLVWIHGGGWAKGDKSSVIVGDKDLPSVFCRENFVLVSVNYRLSPKVNFPTHAEDVGAALGWVKANIAKYGGDSSRISVAGHSAGAHLAALVATDERYLKANRMGTGDLKCAIPVDTNCYDITKLAKESGGKLTDFYAQIFTQNPETWKMASPATYVAKGAKIPPMLIFYSKGTGEAGDQSETRKLYADDFSNKLVSNGFVSSVYGAPEKTHSEIALALSDPNDHVTKAFIGFLKLHNGVGVSYQSFQDIVYKTTDADKNLTSLDVHTPDKSGKNPVLVWIHGGSWSEGDKKTIVTSPIDFPKVFCSEKFVVVSINYRLSPAVKFPVHPQDVASAIAWVKANISKYGGDPLRINIAGHSAGAHLTALVCTDERYLKAVGLNLSDIKSAVPSDAGTYDFIAFANRQKEKKAPMPKNFIEVFTSDEKVWKEASPIYYVEKGKKIPPMLLFYSKGNVKNANNDYYKIDTETFAKKLADNGFEASTHGAPEMDHGELSQSYCNKDAHTTKAFLEFLKKHNFAAEAKEVAYTRTALQIPMRDSKNLAADLYSSDTKAKKPTILVQTPYDKSKYWTQLKQRIPFSLADYNIVILDWRGRFASKDAASAKASTGQDGYDAVEWIAKQTWSNGKIGTYGGSALGDVQFKTASFNPPHLVCAVPMVKDFKVTYEQFFFGGEYRKEQSESLQSLNFFETKTILAQPVYNQYWKLVENKSDISSSVKVPMLLIGGWFDHYPDLVLRAFADIQSKSDPKVKAKHKLIFGPWEHGNLDEKKQGILEFENAVGFGDRHAIMFMDYYLLGKKNNWEAVPTVQYYQMGDEAWKNAQSWDTVPRNEVSCYLNANKTLTFEKPTSNSSSLAFSYDPKDPTPSFGGKRFDPTKPNLAEGPQDQKTVEARKDVLVFSSNPLGADLQINGLVKAQIYFSSNQKDTDISVRFCDVYPDGKSALMAEGIQRARFRNSLEKEELLTPGTVYSIGVKLQNLALTVKKGHKIRIIVSSASYPIFERNPNNGGKLYTDNTLNIAANKVFFGKDNLSRIILPTLKTQTQDAHPAIQSISSSFLANTASEL